MMKLILERKRHTDEYTHGQIKGVCETLELPWKDNQRNVSCIPAGTYKCEWAGTQRIRVLDVPDRSGIQIHVGNYPWEIRGCILPGLAFDSATPAVWNSKLAMGQIRAVTEGQDFELEVIGDGL